MTVPFRLSMSGTAELLDVLIPSHRHKDVRISFWLGHLERNQQIHQIGGQGKRSPICVLGVPFPGVDAVLLGGDLDGHIRKIDVSPRRIHQFATTHAGAQAHANKKLPFDGTAFLLVLPGRFAQFIAFLVCEHSDLSLGHLGRLESAKRMPIELAAVFCQLEHPFEVFDLLSDSARGKPLVKAVLNEPLTMLVSDLLHVDIAYALHEVLYGSLRFSEGREANLPVRAHQAIPEEVREFHRYRSGDVHPQLQLFFLTLTFGLSPVCVAQKDLTSPPIRVRVAKHVPEQRLTYHR